MHTLDFYMKKYLQHYIIDMDEINEDYITIDVRTVEEFIKYSPLKYNVQIINRKEHLFLHKHKRIAGLVVLYGLIKSHRRIRSELIRISNNKKEKLVIGCSKGRLRSPML